MTDYYVPAYEYDSSGALIKLTTSTNTNALNNALKSVKQIVSNGLYYAFCYCTGLTGSVNFPELTSIGDYGLYCAFFGCTGLTGSVNFPKLTSISDYGLYSAFQNCKLTSVNFPELTSIGDHGLYNAFYDCTGLTGSVNFPKLTSISDYGLHCAFYDCTGLTGSVNFPELTSISDYGSDYAFRNCVKLTSVNFPKLTSIGIYGLYNAFSGCTRLTSVNFPKLTSISIYGLYNAFSDCTGLTEIHFHYSLEGSSQCTASNMGCSATVYFDLGLVKLIISNYDSSISYILNGKSLTSNTGCYPDKQNVLIAYKQGYCVYIETIIPTDNNPISRKITLATSGTAYKLNISGADSSAEISTTFNYNGYEVATVTGTNPTIIVPSGTEITYKVKAEGCKSVTGTLTADSSTQDITLKIITRETYNLSYPFDNTAEIFANLIDGSNFEINASPTVNSGSNIQASIINGSKSFKVNNGVSYGYIKFHTPDTSDASLLTVSITCACSAESKYDVGAVFIDTSIHQVTSSYRFPGGSGTQNNIYGYVIYSSYGKASTTYSTYSYSGLQADTDYYLQFAYTKDSSSNSGWDRFSITNITFTDEGTY